MDGSTGEDQYLVESYVVFLFKSGWGFPARTFLCSCGALSRNLWCSWDIFLLVEGFVLEFVVFPGHFIVGGGFCPGICGVPGTFCCWWRVLSFPDLG